MEPNTSNKSTVVTVVVILVILIGGFLLWRSMRNNSTIDTNTIQNQTEMQPEATTTPESTSTPATTASSTTSTTKTYTLAQIASHNKGSDCWFAIHDKVYNVTPFIASGKHPGGAAILQGCGKDATTLFETRPMGSGTPHSAMAHAALANFYIGDLKK
jgi:cytochrome b involved in lipid metabolism